MPKPIGKTLEDCLREDCKRQMSWGEVTDPHAARILEGRHGVSIEKLETRFNALGLSDFTFLGAGKDTLVLGATNQQGTAVAIRVAVRIGGKQNFPDSDYTLEPIHTETIGSKNITIIEQVTTDVTPKEALQLGEKLYKEGNYISDLYLDNLGRTADGSIVVIDPGALEKATDAENLEKSYNKFLKLLSDDTGLSISAIRSQENGAIGDKQFYKEVVDPPNDSTKHSDIKIRAEEYWNDTKNSTHRSTATVPNAFPSTAKLAGTAGVGMSANGLYQSIQSGDIGGTAIAGADFLVSVADLALDLGPVSTSLTKGALTKTNVALTVADGAYQVSQEDGVNHKVERGLAVTATTGAAIAGTATVSGVIPPIAVGAVAAVGTAAIADTVIETRRIYEEQATRFEPDSLNSHLNYVAHQIPEITSDSDLTEDQNTKRIRGYIYEKVSEYQKALEEYNPKNQFNNGKPKDDNYGILMAEVNILQSAGQELNEMREQKAVDVYEAAELKQRQMLTIGQATPQEEQVPLIRKPTTKGYEKLSEVIDTISDLRHERDFTKTGNLAKIENHIDEMIKRHQDELAKYRGSSLIHVAERKMDDRFDELKSELNDLNTAKGELADFSGQVDEYRKEILNNQGRKEEFRKNMEDIAPTEAQVDSGTLQGDKQQNAMERALQAVNGTRFPANHAGPNGLLPQDVGEHQAALPQDMSKQQTTNVQV